MSSHPVQSVTLLALTCMGEFVVGALLGPQGASPIGLAIMPVPVAVYALRGNMRAGAALMVSAACGTALTWGSPIDGALSAGLAAAGWILAFGIQRCWDYRKVGGVVTAVVFAVLAVHLALRWHNLEAALKEGADALEAALLHPPDATAPTGSPSAPVEQYLWVMRWMTRHWTDLCVGMLFTSTLFSACASVSLTSAWLRRVVNRPGPVSSFRTLRMPDWLAWVVIATIALAYADYRWPGMLMRPIAWNAAVALIGLYALTGLAIVAHLAYAMTAMGARFLGYALVACTLVAFSQVVILLGLFDTWFDFRAKLDRLVEAKRRHDRSSGDDR